MCLRTELIFFSVFSICLCVSAIISLTCARVCARSCVPCALACVCACQFFFFFVRVNRDERRRVRVWPCIIHEADLAEESRGTSALL